MRLFVLIFLITFDHLALAQIEFEKGYFINNKDERIECLIKNVDWLENPTEFEYKISEENESLQLTTSTVKEFGILNNSKFIRAEVQIDLSTENLSNLSKERNPTFSKKVIWLRLLVEGKASLYSYREKGIKKYFFNVDNEPINQLVYKLYYDINNKVNKNYSFRNQLWTDVKCSDIKLKEVESLDYKEAALIKYFIEYNECQQVPLIDWRKEEGYSRFNLKITPGINFSSLSIYNDVSNDGTITFSNDINYRIGLEAEFFLPFNKSKWSLIFDPSYNYYKGKTERNNFSQQVIEADFSSIELPLGIKHSFYLNKNLKIFLNAFLVYDYMLKSRIEFEKSTDLSVNGSLNLAFGGGFAYKKLKIEYRYYLDRHMLKNYTYWYSDFNKSSLIIGYTIF